MFCVIGIFLISLNLINASLFFFFSVESLTSQPEPTESCSTEELSEFEDFTYFHPDIPPPPIIGYPVPGHHWTHGEPSMSPFQGVHYPYTYQEAYMFPDSALTTNGETDVNYMPTLNGYPPMYAMQGVSSYHIPPPYHTSPLSQGEPVDLSIQVAEPVDPSVSQSFMHPSIILPSTSSMHSIGTTYFSQDNASIVPVMSPMMPVSQGVQNPYDMRMVFLPHPSFIPSPSTVPVDYVLETDPQAFRPHLPEASDLPAPASTQSLEFYEPVMFQHSTSDFIEQHHSYSDVTTSPVENTVGEILIDVENLIISDPEDQQHKRSQQYQNTDIYSAAEFIPHQLETHAIDECNKYLR